MAEKDPTSPATTSLAYDEMLPRWEKIQTVLDGTRALRAKGTTYLPQHQYEADAVYAERLQRATLYNMTKLTLESWVGRPFSDPITFDKVPPAIDALLTDIDRLGNDVHVFAREWFLDGLAKSYSHVLVDFPRTSDKPGIRTLRTDREENLRPYWILVRPEQLFFAEVSIEAGEERLREVRLMEEIVERDGFAERRIRQIRRLWLDEQGVGNVSLYRVKEEKGKKEVWEEVQTYSYSLPFIPLVTFYSHRDSFMMGTPPLEDLADLNLAHWQSAADQRACLTVARFPILALSGGTDNDKKLKVGPNRWLWCADPNAEYYYVEHTGAAINSGRMDLQDLIDQMAEYGAEFLKKRPGGSTATARAMDSAEATSPLQDVTMRFGKSLTLALQYTAAWLKLPEGGTATLKKDFGPETADQSELTTLKDTRKGRDISRKTYLGELQRRGVLSDEFDIEEDAAELEQEALDLFGTAVPDEEPPTDEKEPPEDKKTPPEDGKEPPEAE